MLVVPLCLVLVVLTLLLESMHMHINTSATIIDMVLVIRIIGLIILLATGEYSVLLVFVKIMIFVFCILLSSLVYEC